MRVKHPKSLQTGCAEKTIWSTMLFSMISFTAVYYTTISIFQHIRAECATVLHENKAEIRTEGGATETLVVCLCVVFFFFFQALLFEQELLSALFFFFYVLFCLSRTPYAINSML